MGIKERKIKHRENLRQSILDAAKMLFLKNGYEATSIRKIAAEIEFSPTTIYLYYKDKAEIIHALHQEGFKMLTEQLKVLRNVEDPFERLKAMGRGYINFAIENRDFYEIMFIMKEPLLHIKESDGEDWAEGDAAFQTLLATVMECQEKGHFKTYEAEAFALLAWGNMHGLCTLNNNGHLNLLCRKTEGVIDSAPTAMQKSFEIYIDILGKI